jgi:hypothetical protein
VTDTGKVSHIVFIVRDDDGQSDLLFQTADTTWQAYNDYGDNNNGKSLYGDANALHLNGPTCLQSQLQPRNNSALAARSIILVRLSKLPRGGSDCVQEAVIDRHALVFCN